MKSSAEYTDFELIQAVIGGEKQLFTELVSRYKNLVYSVVLRMINDREEANDLAQDVFLKLYKNLDKYYPDYKFSTWVIRITTNHVIDYRRKNREQLVSLEEIEYDAASEETPEQQLVNKERTELIKAALNDLPDMYKIPIVLYHQQGLSYQEISDIIEEPLSKVKNRIFRGRKLLKDTLVGFKEGENFGM